jgi:hypothetical protein
MNLYYSIQKADPWLLESRACEEGLRQIEFAKLTSRGKALATLDLMFTQADKMKTSVQALRTFTENNKKLNIESEMKWKEAYEVISSLVCCLDVTSGELLNYMDPEADPDDAGFNAPWMQ